MNNLNEVEDTSGAEDFPTNKHAEKNNKDISLPHPEILHNTNTSSADNKNEEVPALITTEHPQTKQGSPIDNQPSHAQSARKGYPKSLDSEKAVLGSVLINNNLFNDVFAKLIPADFYDQRHQLIASSMLNYRLEQGEAAIDEITLTTLLGNAKKLTNAGGLAYINEIINSVPTILNFEYYVDIVKEKSLLRNIMRYCESALVNCSASKKSETVAEALLQNLYELNSNTYQDYYRLSGNIDETIDSIDKIFQGKGVSAVSSGYVSIDKILGGFQRSNLIIVGGRTGMGKTAFALSMVLRMAHGGHKLITGAITAAASVGFFSLEMSSREIITRLLASEANIDAYKLRQQNQSELNWDHILTGADKLRKLPIFIDDTPGITIGELRLKARRMVQRDKVRLIVIDYLQLITSTEPNIMREQQISNISKQLKNLARELDIPIITLTQLNRNAEMREDKIPKLSDIRESGAIEQDADLVMFVHRPGYDQVREHSNNDTDGEDYHNEAEIDNVTKIYIAKNRHGPTGFAKLIFNDRFMRFEDAVEETRPSF